jgi:hypothetical protein
VAISTRIDDLSNRVEADGVESARRYVELKDEMADIKKSLHQLLQLVQSSGLCIPIFIIILFL